LLPVRDDRGHKKLLRSGSMNNRRRYDRFLLPVGYTPVQVHCGAGDESAIEGHAYDISEGGICFEVDKALTPGQRVGLTITVPGGHLGGESTSAFAVATVVRVTDEDEPGPIQHAAAFLSFPQQKERRTLLEAINSGVFQHAA